MYKLKVISLILFVLALSACESNGTNAKSSEATSNTSIKKTQVGINLQRIEKRTPVNYTPLSGTYYGRLKVETKLKSGVIEGPEAQKLKDYLFNVFGSEKNEFVITFNANIDNITLPPAILLAYRYDSSDKSWKYKMMDVYTSPIFNIKSHGEIDYALSIKSSNNKEIKLFEKAAKAAELMSSFSSGTWVVNKLAEPVVKIGALSLDNEISKAASEKYDSELTSTLFPLSKTSNGSNQYLVEKNNQANFAEISVEVEYYNSLIAGEALSHKTVASVNKAILPEVHGHPDVLNRISVKRYPDIENKLVKDINQTNPTLLNDIKTAQSLSKLDDLCMKLKTELSSTYDLNIIDTNLALFEVVQKSNYVANHNSMRTFNCLSKQDFESLNKMNQNLQFGSVSVRSNQFAKTLIGYLRTPRSNHKDKEVLEGYFTDNVYFESEVEYFDEDSSSNMSKTDIIALLGLIGANRAGAIHYSNKERVGSDLNENLIMHIYYNHHEELNKFYKITLNNINSPGNRISVVKVQYANDNEMSQLDKKRLIVPSEYASESTVKPLTVANNSTTPAVVAED
ncbi:TPA: hypothetical protein ACF4E7_004571 [Vibrio parahaemolyticus]